MSADAARRIVSFLPAATEMIYALGVEDRLFGVTHECDWPPAARSRPVVVRGVLPIERMSQREIDDAVSARTRSGEGLYKVDEAQMREIAPDLIVTQALCHVCAPSGNEVTQLLASLPKHPRVLCLTPRTLEDVFENLRELGNATGQRDAADRIIAAGRLRLAQIAAKTRGATHPRVFCMEWLDPVYCSGHWVPEMVRIAGGTDALGREGTDSVRIAWDDVVAAAPEILIVMPCGYNLTDSARQAISLFSRPGWNEIPAVRDGRVFVVDASSYFARPGPRLIGGTELLAHLLHPELFGWSGPSGAFSKLQNRPASPRTKHCARCGAGFTCGPLAGNEQCWCNDKAHITPRDSYGDCLCPACLDREIAQASLPATPTFRVVDAS